MKTDAARRWLKGMMDGGDTAMEGMAEFVSWAKAVTCHELGRLASAEDVKDIVSDYRSRLCDPNYRKTWRGLSEGELWYRMEMDFSRKHLSEWRSEHCLGSICETGELASYRPNLIEQQRRDEEAAAVSISEIMKDAPEHAADEMMIRRMGEALAEYKPNEWPIELHRQHRALAAHLLLWWDEHPQPPYRVNDLTTFKPLTQAELAAALGLMPAAATRLKKEARIARRLD